MRRLGDWMVPARRAHSAVSSCWRFFAEEGLGGLAKAVDGVAAALAKIDFVRIHLEDLLLIEAMFELEGDHDLAKFASDLFFR